MNVDLHTDAVAKQGALLLNLGLRLRQFLLRLQHWLTRDGPALLVFAVASLGIMYPVVPAMGSRELGGLGDNALYTYMIGWTAQAPLVHQSPFIDPRANYPDDLRIMGNDAPYLSMFLIAPVTWLLGPTFSYNLILLFSHWLSGYAVYLWIRQLTGNRVGGVVAGLAFLLSPYRIVHSYGHLNLTATYAVPLFFWALDQACTLPRPRWRDVLGLSAAAFLVGAASQYTLVICLVTGVFYALFSMLPRVRHLLRYGWRLCLGVGVGAAFSALPYLSNLGQQLYKPYTLTDLRLWSADPINFVLPSRLHPLWGAIVERLRPEPFWGEKTLYVGIVAAFFALLAMCWPHNPYRRRLWVWLGVALIALILALGSDLHINNQPVSPIEPFLLPAYYLSHLPFLSFMRVWARFGVITILFIALSAGVGVAYLARYVQRWQTLVMVAVIALLVIDLLPGRLPYVRMEPRPIDRWLAQQPEDFAVAFLPPVAAGEDGLNYQMLYGSLFHGKHLPAFAHAYHRPAAYDDFVRRAQEFPAPSSIQALQSLGLRYLLLERSRFDGKTRPSWQAVEAEIARSAALRVVTELDGIVVLAFS